jgi:ATP-dependent helicase/nuclease subunit A
VSFEELLTRAAELLVEHPRVAADLRRGIDQLLVDEFQDTDARQCAIVAALALEGAPADRPGLFLVGDPKQSIYGWRNADLEAYEGMLARVGAAGGIVGTLCVNHRSVPAILREVERVVAPVMVRKPRCSPLRGARAQREARGAPGFTAGGRAVGRVLAAHRVRAGAPRETRAPRRAARARALARDLRELHAAHGVAWKSFGLLFRSRGDWDVYLGALREAGIPFSVEGDRTYYRRREIVDAVGFVCCVLDPNDQLALLTLLRSSAAASPTPHGCRSGKRLPEARRAARLRCGRARCAASRCCARGVSDRGSVPGLERIAGWEEQRSRASRPSTRCGAASSAIRRRVRRTAARRALLRGERSRALPRTWRAANLERFFCDLAEAIAAGEPVGALLRRIRRAVAEEETPSAEPTAPGSLDAVTVATLHGAKGLDWDHVYLLQLHKGARARGRRAMRADRRLLETTLVRRPDARVRRGAGAREAGRGGRARAHALRGHDARARAARRVGVLAEFLRGGDESHAALLAQRDPAPPDWTELAGRWSTASDGARRVLGDPGAARAPASTASPRPAAGERDARRSPRSRRSRAPVAQCAADRATVTALAAAVAKKVGAAPRSRSCAFRGDARRHRDPRGARAARSRRGAGRGVGCAARADRRADARGRRPRRARPRGRGRTRVLGRDRDRSACRAAARPLAADPRARAAGAARCLGEQGALGFASGSVDLLYRDADGRLVVVDYKTDRESAEEAPVAPPERYARQGELYCRAVGEALGEDPPPRFEIWWLRTGEIEAIL